jgi:hypothetical protein
MSSINDDDSLGHVNFSEKEGTTIIAVVPKEAEPPKSSKSKIPKRRGGSRREKFPKIMN